MRTIGHGLMEVIDALSIPYVIGLGEGAGANILARFGMDYPQRSLGLILIHCTSTVAGVMEYFRDKVNPHSFTRRGAL
jgi:protein NDRG1